jgi:hypothetical protein
MMQNLQKCVLANLKIYNTIHKNMFLIVSHENVFQRLNIHFILCIGIFIRLMLFKIYIWVDPKLCQYSKSSRAPNLSSNLIQKSGWLTQ